MSHEPHRPQLPPSMALVPALFHDLVGNGEGGILIPATTHRAISIEQIIRLVDHMERRLDGGEVPTYTPSYPGAKLRTITRSIVMRRETPIETWRDYGNEPEYEDWTRMDANLYDIDALVIRPATEGRQCSLVELMAEGEQAPDYFVSHTWAEEVVRFLVCLQQHSQVRDS